MQESESIECQALIKEALLGERDEGQQRIAEIGIKWLSTLLKKNQDYGSSVWKTPVLAPNMKCGDAILVRMSDKIFRVQSILDAGKSEISESLEDTMSDLGSYALLWLARPEGS